MTTVVLLRHGRTTANAGGILAGWTPGVQLDESGTAQVQAVGERLAKVPLAAIVSSPLERCRQTAESVAAVFPGPEGEGLAQTQARAVAAVREWNAKLGPDAVWLACSHGDVIKAILADALGLHLDQFQRIVVDPASISGAAEPARPPELAFGAHR